MGASPAEGFPPQSRQVDWLYSGEIGKPVSHHGEEEVLISLAGIWLSPGVSEAVTSNLIKFNQFCSLLFINS